MRVIDQFQVILFDMAKTFMFGVDRFSETQDFAATYQRIGGRQLSDQQVRDIIWTLFTVMCRDYKNPAYYPAFPSVRSYIETLPISQALPQPEQALIEQIFAVHEVGTVSLPHAQVLHQLHQTHHLGVVSNIFSTSQVFLQEFERVHIRELFDVIVFSSDYGPMKPSAALFEQALRQFSVDRSTVVFVGDSLIHDIAGAKALGLATVWIDHASGESPERELSPDWIIHDIQELQDLPAES